MRALRLVLALVLLSGFMPGLGDLVVEGVAWLGTGRVAHVDEHAPDEATGSEYGCSGLMHHCHCCGVVLVPAPSVPRIGPPEATRCNGLPAESLVSDAHVRGIQRPPSA
ncbi:MAG: hypothetical protein ACOCV4_02510 [Myxococcota bacterium]